MIVSMEIPKTIQFLSYNPSALWYARSLSVCVFWCVAMIICMEIPKTIEFLSYNPSALWYALCVCGGPRENVMLGTEFIWGERQDVDGATGDDYRIQFSLKVGFDSGNFLRGL